MARIQYLTQIEIGAGMLRQLPEECRRLGLARPLLVSDPGVEAAGLLARVQQALGDHPHASWARTPGNPTESAVRECAEAFATFGCDALVAVGGGSSIDLAKGVAIVATHPGPLTHYATIEGGADRITAAAVPLIAIPTTAGTGSEVARGAILIVDDGRKLGFHNAHLFPKLALLDPELTAGLPPLLTAATGMDAIAHCLETFMAPAFNPPADGIALDGLARGWAHLERAVRDGREDLEARLQMMSASMQGALAFQKGLGCVHSLSHALGGIDPRLHHGTLNAVFLPAVVRFNAEADSMRRERRLPRIAHAMGIAGAEDDLDGVAVAEALRARNAAIGLPAGLAAMGVTEALFDRVVERALKDHCHRTNPRIASAEDYLGLLRSSM